MKTIKAIVLILTMQLVGVTANAIFIKSISSDSRPGDGEDKYRARSKQGESLKGYFYRVYGKNIIAAEDIKFKGPFKRKDMKYFLKTCQSRNGYVEEQSTDVIRKDKVGIYTREDVFESRISNIFHVTLVSELNCLVKDKIDFSEKFAAVYLDRDEVNTKKTGLYVDYDNCDSDDRAHLSTGEYSIHYDDNPKCRADLSEISD